MGDGSEGRKYYVKPETMATKPRKKENKEFMLYFVKMYKKQRLVDAMERKVERGSKVRWATTSVAETWIKGLEGDHRLIFEHDFLNRSKDRKWWVGLWHKAGYYRRYWALLEKLRLDFFG